MRTLAFRIFHRIFPFITERTPIHSQKNPGLMIEEDGVWGRHVSSREAFQSGDYPEGMWHAAFHAVPLYAMRPSSILVLGSGAGSSFFVLQRIAKKYGLSFSITGVEHDPVMTQVGRLLYGDAFRKKMSSIRAQDLASVSGDRRKYVCTNLTVHHDDAMQFLQNTQEFYDVILIDLFNGFDLSPLVFRKDFVQATRGRLSSAGIIINNAYTAADELSALWQEYGTAVRRVRYQKNEVIIV